MLNGLRSNGNFSAVDSLTHLSPARSVGIIAVNIHHVDLDKIADIGSLPDCDEVLALDAVHDAEIVKNGLAVKRPAFKGVTDLSGCGVGGGYRIAELSRDHFVNGIIALIGKKIESCVKRIRFKHCVKHDVVSGHGLGKLGIPGDEGVANLTGLVAGRSRLGAEIEGISCKLYAVSHIDDVIAVNIPLCRINRISGSNGSNRRIPSGEGVTLSDYVSGSSDYSAVIELKLDAVIAIDLTAISVESDVILVPRVVNLEDGGAVSRNSAGKDAVIGVDIEAVKNGGIGSYRRIGDACLVADGLGSLAVVTRGIHLIDLNLIGSIASG